MKPTEKQDLKYASMREVTDGITVTSKSGERSTQCSRLLQYSFTSKCLKLTDMWQCACWEWQVRKCLAFIWRWSFITDSEGPANKPYSWDTLIIHSRLLAFGLRPSAGILNNVRRWTKSKLVVILNVICHHQKPSDSTHSSSPYSRKTYHRFVIPL
jgi:hypothetical protein